MSLFNAPAWMMKGGGGAPAEISTMGDDDPYKQGKTKVNLRISNACLNISSNKTKFRLSFSVSNIGFTQNATNVQLYLELKTRNGWKYTNSVKTVNLEKTNQDIDISDQINRSGEVKQLLIDPAYHNVDSSGSGKIYLLFQTNTEIVDNQLPCEVKTT